MGEIVPMSRPERLLPSGQSAQGFPHNLTVQPTPLLGREDEVADACAILRGRAVRFLSLVGPPGIGKTRLALQVALELREHFCDGVYFVPLAPVHDPNLVVSAIALTLGIRESASQSLLEVLKAHLQDRSMLLLLDNFEQVAEAAPDVASLLGAAPFLKVLVTSRMVLHTYGEYDLSVPPLHLPNLASLPCLEELPRYAAIDLFVQRAQAAKHTFMLTTQNAPAVAELCSRLDGLPLAIELAAAGIRVLSAQALLAHLTNRFQTLPAGSWDLPERHKTLHNAIEWSYNLLSPAEQKLLRWFSVFVGGCALQAIEAVCRGDTVEPGNPVAGNLIEGLTSLIDNSLLRQEETADGQARYWMLETIREYGLEQLEKCDERAEAARSHAGYFLALVERAEPHLHGPEQVTWLDRLETEHNNIRSALQWFLRQAGEEREIDEGMRMVGALLIFWDIRGYVREGRSQAEASLQQPGASSHSAGRAKALLTASRLSWFQRDHAAARAFAVESVAIWRTLEDKAGIVFALEGLGAVAWHQGDAETSQPLLEESLAIRMATGHTVGIMELLAFLAYADVSRGNYSKALALIEEYMPLVKQLRDSRGTAVLYHTAAYAALGLGNVESSLEYFRNSMILADEVGDRQGIGWTLTGFAEVACDKHQPLRAARLFGAAEALLQSLGIPPTEHAVDREMYARSVAATRSMLSSTSFDQAWAHGRALTVQQALDYALEKHTILPADTVTVPLKAKTGQPGRSHVSSCLMPLDQSNYIGITPREMDVLRLVADGLTNVQVAERLSISRNTVSIHLYTLYNKLGVRSRAAATRYAIEHKLI